MTHTSTAAGRAVGAMFLCVFGALWLVGWAFQSDRGPTVLNLGVISVAACALLSWSIRKFHKANSSRSATPDPLEAAQARKAFDRINAVLWLAIVALILALNVLGVAEWIEPGILLLVGLHFLPLAWTFGYRPHYLTGAALAVFALSYPFLAADGPLDSVGSLGAGLVLWCSALGMLMPSRLMRLPA